MDIKLRPYQQECLDIIESKGKGRYIVQMATGLGKTVVFTHIPRQGRMLLLSHREELVRQPLKYFDCSAGVEMAGESSHGEEVVSASVQTMIHRLDRFGAEDFDTIIVDECFPSTTKIDGKALTSYKKGDIITSYNHIERKIECKPITHIFKHRPYAMVKVMLSNGQSIACTPNHPFWVEDKGYIPAYKLTEDDYVLYLHNVPKTSKSPGLHGRTMENKNVKIQKDGEDILLHRMFTKVRISKLLKSYGEYKQKICQRKNEEKQSYEKSRDKSQSVKETKRNRASSSNTMWERSRINRTTAKFNARFGGEGLRYICRIPCPNSKKAREWISNLLQDRHCNSGRTDSNRSGREVSFCFRTTGSRQEKRCFFERIRVESVEIQRQTSDGTFGNLCPDGYVYNIEVEGNHNYFVEGVLVHNCHHAAAKSYKEVIGHFKPRMLLGFTATPNRSDGARLNDLFDEIIFKRDLRWGIQNGYLCDIFCKRVDIGYDLSAVHTRMGDYAPGELEKAMDGTADAIAQCYKEHAKGATLIFAVSVDQCEEIAKRIDGAEVITGQTKNRAEIIKRFTAREIPCLVNCMVFTEGTDIPLVETVIIARPTQSDSLYAQMVGRGLRLHPDKDRLTLIDCVGVTGKASLCTAPSLLGIDVEKVPRKKQNDLEGMLFELPEKAEMLSDTPASWIRNVTIVDLWAKNMKYQLHNVNWYQMPDGTMLCNLPDKQVLEISPADELGRTVFMGQIMDMQEAFDRAFELLQQEHSESKAIWDKQIAKKWTEQPATQAQIDFVKRVAKKHLDDIDFDTLTKGQAGMIINRMKGGKHSVRGQRTSRRH